MSWDDFSDYEASFGSCSLAAGTAQSIKSLQRSGRPARLRSKPPRSRGLIAKSFWGKAWCKHLEAFSDYEYRLPRGRSYMRHGAVVDLKIEPQTVTALVNGSELYELTVNIDALAPEKMGRDQSTLPRQDRLADRTTARQAFRRNLCPLVMDPRDGLFPKPNEIHFNCNCPDWADMCKHVAASLVRGRRAPRRPSPELLFKLAWRGSHRTDRNRLGSQRHDDRQNVAPASQLEVGRAQRCVRHRPGQ